MGDHVSPVNNHKPLLLINFFQQLMNRPGFLILAIAPRRQDSRYGHIRITGFDPIEKGNCFYLNGLYGLSFPVIGTIGTNNILRPTHRIYRFGIHGKL